MDERPVNARALTRIAACVAAATCAIFSLLPSPAGATAGHSSVVQIDAGALRGTRIGAADAFLGVPYAAPPVKALRFAPPQPPARWHGVQDATRQAPACLQFAPGGIRETQATSEDCLYLDLYRPSRSARGDRPVIVWMHGGGYTQGTGVIYGGETLAALTDSIVISLNYRLGALGYLALDQLDAENPSTGSGNWGLLDQIAALNWVKRNIRAFGGDARNVTIAGQSAGGSAVCTLLASPKAAGLFQHATIQSAGCGLGERTLSAAQAQGSSFAKEAGCNDAATRLACLRSAWAPGLVSAFQRAGGAGPVTGTPTLPLASTAAIAAGRWNKVPVIIGASSCRARRTSPPRITRTG